MLILRHWPGQHLSTISSEEKSQSYLFRYKITIKISASNIMYIILYACTAFYYSFAAQARPKSCLVCTFPMLWDVTNYISWWWNVEERHSCQNTAISARSLPVNSPLIQQLYLSCPKELSSLICIHKITTHHGHCLIITLGCASSTLATSCRVEGWSCNS